MSDPRRPYRSVDHPLPLQRGPGHPLGFIRTVDAKVAQLKREVAGLKDRLKYRYGDDTGDAHAYKGQKLFRPDPAEVTIPTVNVFGDPPFVGPVNVVVPDGQLLSVPIVIEGPGVFMARYFKVTFAQRVWGGDGPDVNDPTGLRVGKEYFYQLPIGKSFSSAVLARNTRKFSLPLNLDTRSWSGATGTGASLGLLGVDFFWNLNDRDSERRLADEPVSQQALLPPSTQNQVDGNLFEFGVPWLFERAGTLEFQFQMLTPILQPSVASGVFPFAGWDDTEENGTVRNMSVMVRCELHGTKFITERDTLLREAV